MLAHSHTIGKTRYRKGQLLSAADCAAFAAAEVSEIYVAQLDADDMSEDAAALALAQALCNASSEIRIGVAATGRCNLYASGDGILKLDVAKLHEFNSVNPAITFATLQNYSRVSAGQMVGTVKIIPFALARTFVDAAIARLSSDTFCVKPFTPKSIACIITQLPGSAEKLIEKSAQVTQARCTSLGANMSLAFVIDHKETEIAAAILSAHEDIILISGAVALVDFEDVIPRAIKHAGGSIIRIGMPVDPGNLLCLGISAKGQFIIGLPGCARSPKLNGFDWVLERLCANISVTSDDIAHMAIGGLLDEMPTRPALRRRADHKSTAIRSKCGALILAAGRSSRMKGANKLLCLLDEKPLICHTLACVQNAQIEALIITGRDTKEISRIAENYTIPNIFNENFAEGLSTSLRIGLACAPKSWDAVFIVLADMPKISPEIYAVLQTALRDHPDIDAVYPRHLGQQGHPVLWRRSAWQHLMALTGDAGGKSVLQALGDRALAIDVETSAVLLDIDTPEALAAMKIISTPETQLL